MPESKRNFSLIGQNVERREDARLLVGRGRFVDDIALPGLTHAAVLPSPYPHARIVRIDTSAAIKLPGVLLVMTGAEAAEHAGPLPSFSSKPVPQYCIAIDKVRYVGEPVAAVVAEDRYIAEDALSLIKVDYEELPAQVDMEKAALAIDVGLVHSSLGTNVVSHERYKWGPVDEAFSSAAHVVRRKIRWPRVGPQPIETCGAVADYDSVDGRFTIWTNFSLTNISLPWIASTLRVEPSRLKFPTLQAGGSFGGKGVVNYIPILTALLARAVGRPVKFVEDRLEHMAAGGQHASDRIYDASLALDAQGHFTALRIRVTDDFGAYFGISLGSHGNALSQATGPYRIGALEYEVRAVLTNKTQQCPYRGFGAECGNFVLERLVDAAARETKRDRLAIRRLNYIQPNEFPYRLPHGNIYDSGNYPAVLDRALDMADLPAFEKRKAEGQATGKRIGIGIASVNERSVLSITEVWLLDKNPPFPISSTPESVQVRIDAAGTAIATIYAPIWGNSPETMVVQIVAENMGMPPERVAVVFGDTDSGMVSFGPAGSRYTVMIAGAVAGACRLLKSKMLAIAAHVLGAEAQQLEMQGEYVFVRSAPERRISYGEIAVHAHSLRLALPNKDFFSSGLVAHYTYDHPFATMPNADRSDLGVFYPIVGHAVHVAVVEIDEELRKLKFLKYVAVHDAGTIVNPRQVDGQIRGGIAQGIGTALYEKYNYNEDGQFITGSLADYMVPTSMDIPDIVIGHIETPSPFTEFGIKGCGEGGRLAAMPAIASAIDDAFADIGLFVDELPVTPSRLDEALARLV